MKKEFEDYKTIHDYMYPNDPLKSWINETNFTDIFLESWDPLMDVVEKIMNLDTLEVRVFVVISGGEVKFRMKDFLYMENYEGIKSVHKGVVEFLNWYKDDLK